MQGAEKVYFNVVSSVRQIRLFKNIMEKLAKKGVIVKEDATLNGSYIRFKQRIKR